MWDRDARLYVLAMFLLCVSCISISLKLWLVVLCIGLVWQQVVDYVYRGCYWA